eukprot:Gb_36757 [translate_table: standard]
MPLFVSDAELQEAGSNIAFIVEKADSHIRELHDQLETYKARADAASITAEQSCALLEQKYISLSAQFTQLENEKSQLSVALDKRATELAQVQTQTHKLELGAIKKDSEVERLSLEVSELHKAKRELLEVLDHKSTELNEKNNLIKSYLDKIVALTDDRSALEAKLHENEAELARSHATQARLSQEKELIQKHNTWLNEELTSKVNSILQQRQTSAEVEAELSAKLADAETKGNEIAGALQRCKEKVKDLEEKLASTREELRFTKEEAAVKEEHFSAEVATASKLADLYKQSSEEWCKKANELEGVIKALEVHLNQIESDYKEKLGKEVAAREDLAKEAAELKEKLEKIQADVKNSRTEKDSDMLALVDFSIDRSTEQMLSIDSGTALELHGDGMLVPRVPSGISGTALAASLLRDGWSLAKIYTKYQEAIDAWRHERQGRRQSQAILERVLHEIEEKAEVILDERAEHTRMIEAYGVMEQKLQQSMSDQANLDNTVRDLKAELRKREREYGIAQKEVHDLQTQVTVLLKECRDIQLRCGVVQDISNDDTVIDDVILAPDGTASDKVISDRLLTFKDIQGMVEQNCQLRSLVRTLAQQNEQREQELKEAFDYELKIRTNEAASKVAVILKKSEEQSNMIESLQGTVGMYKRLYEEELKSRSFFQYSLNVPPDDSRKDLRRLVEISQEATQKAQEQAAERIRCLEEDLKNAKHEAHTLRTERDRLVLEASYGRERLNSFMKDSENQRNEMNAVLSRNVEFSQLITEYQRKSRETSQSTHASEELARRLSVEVSVLEREKEILSNAEKRASEEVIMLSDRVHRLQATLDTIQSVDEVRESSRATERKRLEDSLNRLQREWADAKQELEVEREHVRNLTIEREQTIKQAMGQVESMSKNLADALRAVSAAEARAMVAEARCADLEANLKKVEDRASGKEMDTSMAVGEEEVIMALQKAREEIEQLREDLQASKQHTEQFKFIAQANEDALRQIESAHNHFKTEADKLKQSLEAEVSALKNRISELEDEVSEKEVAAATAREEKEKVLTNSNKEIASLVDDNYLKSRQMEEAQICITALKEDLEKEHDNWRTAQNNYERQVVLQAETIRELSRTSESLATLQDEVLELRKVADAVKIEYESSKVSWEMENASLQSSKVDAESKFKEIDEQNKILLDRLEAMHIKIAEKERMEMGMAVEGQSVDTHGESDLQNVIRYLRRTKETADTEISLLKQERMRLQKQLENALQASEMTQAVLRRERENSRANIYTDEEFRSLQCQVREMNLLRESNAQLRAENRRNFEECQDLRERAQKAQLEIEQLRKSLREKEIELDASQKELEMQKMETSRWENRVSKLLEKYKTIDVEDYDRIKIEFEQLQETLEAIKAEMDLERKLVAEKQERISNLEQELFFKEARFSEMEKKLQDISQSEVTFKLEAEKLKKQMVFHKRRIDSLIKEKEDFNKEKQLLAKQIEDMRSNTGKKAAGELSKQQESVIRQEMAAQHEQTMREAEIMLKEKDARIQILEKTLERERDELRREREELRKERDENRREKVRRQRDQKTFCDLAQKAVQEKKKFQDEFESYKRLRGHYIESSGSAIGELQSESLLDEKAVSYLSAVDQLEETSNSVAFDVSTVRSSSIDVPPFFEASGGVGEGLPAMSSALGNVSSAASGPPVKMTLPIVTAAAATAVSTVAVTSAGPLIVNSNTALRQFQRQALITNTATQQSTVGLGGSSGLPIQMKGAEEKEQRLHQRKAILEDKEKSRKTGRRIIRPRIEPSSQQDSAMEAEGSEMEADILEEGKSGVPLEAETQGVPPGSVSSAQLGEPDIASLPSMTGTIPFASGIRKRVASTSHPDAHEEISTEQEPKSDLAPLQKKPRGLDLEGLADQGNCPLEITQKVTPMEITQEAEERDNVVNEVELKDELRSELSEMGASCSIGIPELEAPISKRPRMTRMDDSEKQPQAEGKESEEVKPELEEPNESEGPIDSSDKARAMDETVDTSGYQVTKGEFDDAKLAESPVNQEDVIEEGEVQDSQKQESSAVAPSLVEIPSGVEDIGKQQGAGLLIVEFVDNADASNSARKESEIEAVHSSGLDVENDKLTMNNSPAEVVEGGQISDVPADIEEGEIPVDLGEIESASGHLDCFPGDEEVSHEEDKFEMQIEGSMQDRALPSEEVTENPDQAHNDLDQPSQQAPVVNTSDAPLDQISHQIPMVNTSDVALDEISQQVPVVNNSDTAGIEEKGKTDQVVSTEAVQESARPTTRNTTIHLADRARERSLIRERERRIGMSPSPVSRGRGRAARGAKRGAGLARGRGSPADDQQGQ